MIDKLYHKYNDNQKKVCYDTDINNKGQKIRRKIPERKRTMRKNMFALSYLYSLSHLSLEHSYEGLFEMRSYRFQTLCKDGSSGPGI